MKSSEIVKIPTNSDEEPQWSPQAMAILSGSIYHLAEQQSPRGLDD